jgi:hypothetical protein
MLTIKLTVLDVTVPPFCSLGAIISLESGVEHDKKVYQITISHFPECTCPDFLNMAVVSIGKRAPYVNCKHLYYIFCYFCKMNCQDDKFIQSPSFSFNEVKQLFVQAQIISQSLEHLNTFSLASCFKFANYLVVAKTIEGDLQIIFEIHRRQKGGRLVDFGLVIPLPVPAVGLGFTLKYIFS